MPLQDRIAKALDVSAAFDNCFFHTYATHLLANNQALPNDLFTFTSIAGPDSPASQLQKAFANDTSLSLFEKYHQKEHSGTPAPSFIMEKTLVLGFLLREWFATQMTKTPNLDQDTQDWAVKGFLNYIGYMVEAEDGAGIEYLFNDEKGVLLLANEQFLKYAFFRSPTSHVEPNFERYFVQDDFDATFKNFWIGEGFSNYCKLIAEPRTKLSFKDIAPVIEQLKQPLAIYSADAKTIYNYEGAADNPKMEVVLYAQEGHYCLLKTDKNTPFAQEYETAYRQYKQDRESLLAHTENKLAFAQTMSSIFVAAICPPGLICEDPFQLLIEQISKQQNLIAQSEQVQASIAQQHEEQPRLPIQPQVDTTISNSSKRLENTVIPIKNIDEVRSPLPPVTEANQPNKSTSLPNLSTNPTTNPDIESNKLPEIINKDKKKAVFDIKLKELERQIKDLYDRMIQEKDETSKDYKKLHDAYTEATTLHESLKIARDDYFNNKQSYVAFQKAVINAIEIAKPVLEIQRGGIKKILEDLINSIRSLWSSNTTLFKLDTKSIEIVNEIQKSTNKIAPSA